MPSDLFPESVIAWRGLDIKLTGINYWKPARRRKPEFQRTAVGSQAQTPATVNVSARTVINELSESCAAIRSFDLQSDNSLIADLEEETK